MRPYGLCLSLRLEWGEAMRCWYGTAGTSLDESFGTAD